MSNIDGIWDCIVVAPVGKEPHELVLQSGPGGTLTGQMKNLVNGSEMPLQEGKVDGTKLTWTMQMVKPFMLKVNVEVEVNVNELKGQGTALLGKVPLTGTKRA